MYIKKLQAVIFDMDGVIVDTDQIYHSTNQVIAEELSIPFTYNDSEKVKGIPRMEIIELMVKRTGKHFSLEEKERLAAKKNTTFLAFIDSLDETFILPGIVPFLEELKKNQIKMGLASSSSNQKTVIQKVGLGHYFDVMVDPKTLLKGKPDPEIFLTAADSLGVPYRNCAALEDGEAGMTAILSTDMFSVGIGNGCSLVKQSNWHVENTNELTYDELKRRFNSSNS
ncbi:beta-phosphoglucomutase [Litchfieldia salsa]|uniref:Beta-phosphoglucomutase n=1 Tax=Litchfieldia salsa TaxID=930152 RepID=A0A1H0RQ93_9BACI|nr:beta-phosphoglucomutase [Litchfieldia salsa]SDP31633.1 beta-phosphoglucomutase [Litchfieldia salsa]